MKKIVKTAAYILLSGMISCVSPVPENNNRENTSEHSETEAVPNPDPLPEKSDKKIKLAILLDTSNSMDGLIEQVKNQLWKIVTQLAKAVDSEGKDPVIEIALYQYGNDRLNPKGNYIEKIVPFTGELDEISEQLFALTTLGGSEYCGAVIKSGTKELEWSTDDKDLQLIYIAGNEPFDQGPINFSSSCRLASEKNIIINTIFCGDYEEGIRTYWKDGADLGNGSYAHIDKDAKTIHIESPFDDKITALNKKLNETYLPFGQRGASKKQKQLREDENARSYGKANAVKRYVSKGTKVYKNYSWDLVDAIDQKGFDISTVEESGLPEILKGLSDEEKLQKIREMKEKRAAIKKEIGKLNLKREKYVAQEKVKMAEDTGAQLEDAILASLKEQAKNKQFRFSDEIN